MSERAARRAQMWPPTDNRAGAREDGAETAALAVHEARCKVCTSPHRTDVEKLWAAGATNPQMADYMRQRGESISAESVRRHFASHVDVERASVEASSEIVQEAMTDRLGAMARLDDVIVRTLALSKRLEAALDWYVEQRKTPPVALAQAYGTALSEHRQALKMRAEMLGGQPQDEMDDALAQLWEVVPQREQPEPAAPPAAQEVAPRAGDQAASA